MEVAVGIGDVAETDAHVANDGCGYGDGEGIEVSVVQEKRAGGEAHDEGDDGEDGIGKVSEREDAGRGEDGGGGVGEQALEALQEEVL